MSSKIQTKFDNREFARLIYLKAPYYCVSPTVETYLGRAEIEKWIRRANDEYQTKMIPLAYLEGSQTLEGEISGRFKGSPLILHYHFEIEDGRIHYSLETKLP